MQEPSFGTSTIDNQRYIENSPIPDETPLPEATSGNGTLTYSLTPILPNGLDFDEDTRIISGTPTDAAEVATYTYTATDEDDDEVTLQLTITVSEDLMPEFALNTTIAHQRYIEDDPIDHLILPEVTSGSGNGTIEYSVTPALLSGLDFDEDTRTLSGTPTDAAAVATYTYTATDEDNDEVTLQFTIIVEEDLMPAFALNTTIDNQTYMENVPISELTLPEVTSGSGNGTIEYSLTPILPNGLDFDEDTRIISGTPRGTVITTTYTYTATDEDNDEVTLQFTITVEAVVADVTPTFNSKTILNQAYIEDHLIDELTLPEATSGNGTLTYSLTPSSFPMDWTLMKIRESSQEHLLQAVRQQQQLIHTQRLTKTTMR